MQRINHDIRNENGAESTLNSRVETDTKISLFSNTNPMAHPDATGQAPQAKHSTPRTAKAHSNGTLRHPRQTSQSGKSGTKSASQPASRRESPAALKESQRGTASRALSASGKDKRSASGHSQVRNKKPPAGSDPKLSENQRKLEQFYGISRTSGYGQANTLTGSAQLSSAVL